MFPSKEIVSRDPEGCQAISSRMMCSWSTVANFWLPLLGQQIFAEAFCLMKMLEKGYICNSGKQQIATAACRGYKRMLCGKSAKRHKLLPNSTFKKQSHMFCPHNIRTSMAFCTFKRVFEVWTLKRPREASFCLWKVGKHMANIPDRDHILQIFQTEICTDRHLIYRLLSSPGMQAMNHWCWQWVRGYQPEKQKKSSLNKAFVEVTLFSGLPGLEKTPGVGWIVLKASRNGSGMKVHKFAMGGKLIKHGKLGSFCSHQFQTLRRIILPVCKAEERKTFILRSSYYIFWFQPITIKDYFPFSLGSCWLKQKWTHLMT